MDYIVEDDGGVEGILCWRTYLSEDSYDGRHEDQSPMPSELDPFSRIVLSIHLDVLKVNHLNNSHQNIESQNNSRTEQLSVGCFCLYLSYDDDCCIVY